MERRGKLAGQWLGKSPWLQSVHFFAAAEPVGIGSLVEIDLADAGPNSIAGARPVCRAA